MSHGAIAVGHWADAFIAALGADGEAGLACLKAMVPPIKAIPGALFGRAVSRRLEKLLRESVDTAGFSGAGAMHAIRLIALLVERNHFGQIDSIMLKVEERLDRKNGVLTVTVESAEALDSEFEKRLRQQLAESTGAAGIKLRTRLAPNLLGGYRLTIGGMYIDASLRGQMDRMKTDLEAAVLATPGGGA